MAKEKNPNRSRAAKFRCLVEKFVKEGINIWDARMLARQTLDHPLSEPSPDYGRVDQETRES